MLALLGVPPVISMLLGVVALIAGATTHHTVLLLVGVGMLLMSAVRAVSRKNSGRQ